jgi:glucoamylase
MPLVWAHAEYAKLVRSLHDGRVFDMPQPPYERYVRQKVVSTITLWAPQAQARTMPAGNRLRVQTPPDRVVRWSAGDAAPVEVEAHDTTLGVWFADLDTSHLAAGSRLSFAIVAKGSTTQGEQHQVEVT